MPRRSSARERENHGHDDQTAPAWPSRAGARPELEVRGAQPEVHRVEFRPRDARLKAAVTWHPPCDTRMPRPLRGKLDDPAITTHCTFCNLIHGSAEVSICHEDADAIAFMDIQPVNNGHVLVVPREHHESLLEVPEELGMHLFKVTMRLANAVRDVSGCDASEHRREQRSGSGAGRAALSRAHHSAARRRRFRHSAAVRRLADAGSHRARCIRGANHRGAARSDATGADESEAHERADRASVSVPTFRSRRHARRRVARAGRRARRRRNPTRPLAYRTKERMASFSTSRTPDTGDAPEPLLHSASCASRKKIAFVRRARLTTARPSEADASTRPTSRIMSSAATTIATHESSLPRSRQTFTDRRDTPPRESSRRGVLPF